MPHAAGRKSKQTEFTPPLLVSDLHYACNGKSLPEKALTISGVDQFTRRGGTCRLHAIFMNQLCIIWGYQEELSSTAGHGERTRMSIFCPQHLSERTFRRAG